MKKLNLKSIIWQEGAYFVAQCLEVDVSSFGETKAEAIKNLDEALELYFDDASKIEIPIIKNAELLDIDVIYA